MDSAKEKKKEEFWGKDAKPSRLRFAFKLLFSLLAMSAMTALLATYSLYKITDPVPAKATMQKVIKVIFTRMASNNETQKIDIAKLLASIEETTKEIPSLKINLNSQELTKLPPEQAIDSISQRAAEALYEQQTIKVPASLGELPIPVEPQADGSRSIQFFNRATHDSLREKLPIVAAIAGFLLIVVALLSQRGGRLSAPGWSILIPSLPVFVILYYAPDIAKDILSRFNTSQYAQQIDTLITDILPNLLQIVRPVYLAAVITGAACIIGGIIIGLILRTPSPKTSPLAELPEGPSKAKK
jgi:hypothetical protein